MKLAAFCWK